MLCRAACRFSTLKVLLALTNKTPSMEVFEKSVCMALHVMHVLQPHNHPHGQHTTVGDKLHQILP